MGNNSSLSFDNYKNRDGFITKETLVEYMEETIQKRYRALLKRVDKNGDGVMTKDELKELFKEQEAKNWLKDMLDLNCKGEKAASHGHSQLLSLYSNNGVVTKESLVAGMDKSLDKRLKKIVKHADKNDDQVVNNDEFKKLMSNEENKKWFKKMVNDDEIFKNKPKSVPAPKSAPAKQPQNTEAEKLFSKYKDGSNVITKESLVKVMDKVVDARAQKIMTKTDKDKNKQIDKKELEKLLKVEQDAAWFSKMVDVFGKSGEK